MVVESDHIICDRCNYKFERNSENKNCCNCFVCTGCEIYYCPQCDEEIIIKPVRQIRDAEWDHQD